MSTLAIHGGDKVRKTPMPARLALGDAEIAMIHQVVEYYHQRAVDPGYEGHFETEYTKLFVEMMGGGHADAVSSGTNAIYVALAALDLPKGSEVLVSPITDPGTLSAVILNGLKPRLMDSRPQSYNVGPEQFADRITPNVTGAVIVHAAGDPAPIGDIVAIARVSGIKVLEDCAQAHFATVNGRPVGTFGDIAAFSTMYRKAHSTGGSGGVVYTRNVELARRAQAHADRGKPRWQEDFSDRDPGNYLFPALNHNTDEISCAIGVASLSRLQETIAKRRAFVETLVGRLIRECRVCRPHPIYSGEFGFMPDDVVYASSKLVASPFFYTVMADRAPIRCSKIEFAEAVRAEGIDLNPHYKFTVRDWPYIHPHLADDFDTPNARDVCNRSFNLYLNENYAEQEADDIVAAIRKVEGHFAL